MTPSGKHYQKNIKLTKLIKSITQTLILQKLQLQNQQTCWKTLILSCVTTLMNASLKRTIITRPPCKKPMPERVPRSNNNLVCKIKNSEWKWTTKHRQQQLKAALANGNRKNRQRLQLSKNDICDKNKICCNTIRIDVFRDRDHSTRIPRNRATTDRTTISKNPNNSKSCTKSRVQKNSQNIKMGLTTKFVLANNDSFRRNRKRASILRKISRETGKRS